MADIVITGNLARVVINNVEIELVQNVRISSAYGNEPVSGIGEIKPRGHVPTMYRGTATFSKMLMTNEQIARAGIVLRGPDEALRGNEFDIEIFRKPGPDGSGGGLVKKLIGCVNEGGDVAVTAHRIVVTDATFVGRDESGDLGTEP